MASTEYDGGFNHKAIAALAFGIVVTLIGLAVPPLRWLYDYAWFVGFLASGALYVILMTRSQPAEKTAPSVPYTN